MEIWQALMLAAVGCLAGFLNVMAGGGSLLALPVLRLMGMPGPLANGTNRVALLAQNVAATAGFRRQGFSDLRLSLSLTLCALPGTVAGALLGTRLDGVWFNRTLAAVMVGVMLLMVRKKKKDTGEDAQVAVGTRRFVLGHVLMLGVGFYGGFIQAGVGFLLMAVLHRVLGLDLVRVNMHKVFIVGVYTLVALAIFAARGHVNWIAGLILAAGNSTGGWVGSHFAVRKGERLIRIIFHIALAALALKLLIG